MEFVQRNMVSDTLKQAQMFVRDAFEGTYIIIKDDIVEKQYKYKGK